MTANDHNDAYRVEIIETYHGDDISAELFESHAREDLIERGIFIAKPEHPFGVRIFDADELRTVPFGVCRFKTLSAARAHFEGIE